MSNRIVITVLGKDKTGIVAGITNSLAEMKLNIEDMTSGKMQDLFVMLILADSSKTKLELGEIKKNLEEAGAKIGVQVIVQHEDVFRYMHRV
ncbi:MAG: ACT domain-containing protein [Candidatus Micrarchaeota archaeon]